MTLYTLMSPSGSFATGIFPSQDEAEYWAAVKMPEMPMRPVELLLTEDQKARIAEEANYTGQFIQIPKGSMS